MQGEYGTFKFLWWHSFKFLGWHSRGFCSRHILFSSFFCARHIKPTLFFTHFANNSSNSIFFNFQAKTNEQHSFAYRHLILDPYIWLTLSCMIRLDNYQIIFTYFSPNATLGKPTLHTFVCNNCK